jgi:hypothetical protein
MINTSEERSKRAYSTRFEDHQGLLTQMARKCYLRLAGAGIYALDVEDILGEFAIAYTRALRSWDAAKGSFATYLALACYRQFNNVAEPLLLEQYGELRPLGAKPDWKPSGRMGLQAVSIEDLNGDEQSEGSDKWAWLPQSMFKTPAESYEAQCTYRDFCRDVTLLEETKAYVRALLEPDYELSPATRARIARRSGEVRSELATRFGVELQRLRP